MSVWKVQRFLLRRNRIFTQLASSDRHDQFARGEVSKEAEIAYATLALVTDYDCWHPDHDSVTVEMVIANLQRNALMLRR